MKQQGEIYYHPEFEFKNGGKSEKLIILLNAPSKNEPCLFVKTTSQEKNKPLKPGCNKSESLFFIPIGSSTFSLNTWVELYEIYEMPSDDVIKNQAIEYKDKLDGKTIEKIIECLFIAEDENIISFHRKLIRPVLQNGLIKLKEKWDFLSGKIR